MRHLYIRGILALIWLASAIYSALGGNLKLAGLYLLMCGAFAASAYMVWKNEKDKKGGN